MEMILTGALSFDIQSHDHKSKERDKEHTKQCYTVNSILTDMHLYNKDTLLKWTLRVDACLSLFLLVDSQ